jgi:hypothetical protein
MKGKPGPFEILKGTHTRSTSRVPASLQPIKAPDRNYSCENYDTCLDLAAALNWYSFDCNGCVGQVNEAIVWRARQARKKDLVAEHLCQMNKGPSRITVLSNDSPIEPDAVVQNLALKVK